MKYLKLFRAKHYIKNLLVFTALICAGVTDFAKVRTCCMGFIAFCLMSSAVYIINDIRDAEKDRLDGKDRPIATGEISKRQGMIFAVVFIVASLIIIPNSSVLFLLLYLGLNIGYSFGLKKIPLVDIAILSSGYIIRVLYGAYISDIVVSGWLCLTVICFSLFFALGKRCGEQKKGVRKEVLSKYPKSFLERNMYVYLGMANIFYALWSMEKSIWSIPLIILITMKYSLDVEASDNGDPVEVLLKDKALMVMCLVYIVAMLGVFYGRI